jgi:hypothetical protein
MNKGQETKNGNFYLPKGNFDYFSKDTGKKIVTDMVDSSVAVMLCNAEGMYLFHITPEDQFSDDLYSALKERTTTEAKILYNGESKKSTAKAAEIKNSLEKVVSSVELKKEFEAFFLEVDATGKYRTY